MAKKKGGSRESRRTAHRMVRVPADVYEMLQGLASRNVRPVSWEVLLALRNHLAAAGCALPNGGGAGGPSGRTRPGG